MVRFLPLEALIAAHFDDIFCGLYVVEHHQSRVTRSASAASDCGPGLTTGARSHRDRRGNTVRPEVADAMPGWIVDLLVDQLRVADNAVWQMPGPLDLSSLMQICIDVDHSEPRVMRTVPAEGCAISAVLHHDRHNRRSI